MKMRNLLFYKYVEIADPKAMQEKLFSLSEHLELKGKILLAAEGINGCITGTIENTEKFMQKLHEIDIFSDVEFKEGITGRHNFKRMIVRLRPEIVTLKQPTKVQNKAPYIEPQELKELLDKGEEVVLVDARNNYESKIGRFKGAITPDIDVFSEWPQAVQEVEDLKDKTIITYCTGGIRCEKASAYMIEQGFTNVKQLHGGIIRYGQECGNDHWEGKCFVFDKRGAIDIDPNNEQEPISQCEICFLPCDTYHNCELHSCDKRFIACEECLEILGGCCSKQCRNQKARNDENQKSVPCPAS